MFTAKLAVACGLGAGIAVGTIAGLSVSIRRAGSIADLSARVATIEDRVVAIQPFGTDTTEVAPAPLANRSLTVDGAGTATKGNLQARVALIEFTDPQCPFCGRFARETFNIIDEEFVLPGRVLYAIRFFPIERIHPFAFVASEFLYCASEQNRFWDLHHVLFGSQRLARSEILGQASSVGLDVKRLSQCADGPAEAKVRQDAAEATRIGVHSTPTFVLAAKHDKRWVAQQMIVGAQSIDTFRRYLSAALADEQRATRASGTRDGLNSAL